MKLLTDILEQFRRHRLSLNHSAETVYGQGRILVGFVAWLATVHNVRTADRLQKRHLHGFQRHLTEFRTAKGRPLKPGTVNNRVRALRVWLLFMRERSYVVADLAGAIYYVKAPRVLPAVLDHAEVRKLLAGIDTTTAMGYRNRTIVELLYSCAIRRAELLGLTLADVDLDHATAKVFGKGSKERVVPIGRTALRYLEGYIRAVRPFWPGARSTQALFLSKYGRPLCIGAIDWLMNHYLPQLPTRVTAHTFRRSCATELVRGNANLYHVKQLLGHASLASLRPYVDLTINDLRKTHAKCHPRERDEQRERG